MKAALTRANAQREGESQRRAADTDPAFDCEQAAYVGLGFAVRSLAAVQEACETGDDRGGNGRDEDLRYTARERSDVAAFQTLGEGEQGDLRDAELEPRRCKRIVNRRDAARARQGPGNRERAIKCCQHGRIEDETHEIAVVSIGLVLTRQSIGSRMTGKHCRYGRDGPDVKA